MSDQAQTQTPISELFDADPLGHSDQDIDRIIDQMRKDRAAFLMPKLKETKASAKKPALVETAATKQLSLDDLGL